MKKTLFSLASVVLLSAVSPVTVFAHGGHGFGIHCGERGNAVGTSQYALCVVEDCVLYGPHEHDGAWYCNQRGINWSHYEVCATEGCDALGLHEHDGVWYHCANYPNDTGYFSGGRGRNRW